MEKSFAENLKYYRQMQGISQREMAERMNVDRSTIAHWENGDRTPSYSDLGLLAEILETEVSALLNASPNTGRDIIIVVDDEEIALKGAMSVLLTVAPNSEIRGFSRISDAIAFVKQNAESVSVAFLDIEIGTNSGLKLSETLHEISPKTKLIFLTSFPDYALSAWDTEAVSFILKPLKVDSAKRVLEKVSGQ